MNHAFKNVTPAGLLTALQMLAMTPRTERLVPLHQLVSFGIDPDNGYWVFHLSDAADGDATLGNGFNHRTFSSPDFAHVVYSALCDHHEAMDNFKLATGWTK